MTRFTVFSSTSFTRSQTFSSYWLWLATLSTLRPKQRIWLSSRLCLHAKRCTVTFAMQPRSCSLCSTAQLQPFSSSFEDATPIRWLLFSPDSKSPSTPCSTHLRLRSASLLLLGQPFRLASGSSREPRRAAIISLHGAKQSTKRRPDLFDSHSRAPVRRGWRVSPPAKPTGYWSPIDKKPC